MKSKFLLLLTISLFSISAIAQKKKGEKSPYMKEAPKQKVKTPAPGNSTTPKPAPVRPKEAPKTAEELEKRRAEIKDKQATEKKELQEKKAKALKEMSFAQELATSSIRFSSGFKLGANLMALNMADINPARFNENGLPVLVNGQIVKDALSSSGQVGIGYNAALFTRISKGSFYLQPEIMIQTKGGAFSIKKGTEAAQKVNVRYNNIEIPLMFGIRSRNLRFTTGPSIGFALKANSGLINGLKSYTDQDLSGLITKFNFGYNAGVGFEKNNNIIDFRLNLSFKKPTNIALGTDAISSQFAFSPRIFQFSYGRIIESK
jgi:Outer membrane protein beta-barrel domain